MTKIQQSVLLRRHISEESFYWPSLIPFKAFCGSYDERVAKNHSTVGRRFASTFGVVFDVDDVLLHGKTLIPGAREVLLELEATNTPFAVMTNGGGYRKDNQARQIEGSGVFVPTEPMRMSHTPMHELAHKHRVLAVGKDCVEIRKVMANYGFNYVGTVDQLHRYLHNVPERQGTGPFEPRQTLRLWRTVKVQLNRDLLSLIVT
ncbi:hypothetical protein F441_21800, partial [Phytophthora nicotianae CJ01A1]